MKNQITIFKSHHLYKKIYMIFILFYPLFMDVYFYLKALSDDRYVNNNSDQFNPIYYFFVIMVIYAINNKHKFYLIIYLIYVALSIVMNFGRVVYTVFNEVDFRVGFVDFPLLFRIGLYHIPSAVMVVIGIVLLNQINKEIHDAKLTAIKNVG